MTPKQVKVELALGVAKPATCVRAILGISYSIFERRRALKQLLRRSNQ